MTQIAQKIDNENRELIKRNSELKIEFKSQEKDRDLLIRYENLTLNLQTIDLEEKGKLKIG